MTDVFQLLHGDTTPLYLAPQAGVSESPFRRLCRRYGADVVVSEFVSAAGIVMGTPRSRDYLRFDEAERPIGIQIFGADPAQMGDAAAYVADVFAPDFIDINFGCPVKKVVKRNGGSGCLRDLDLVQDIIRAVDGATNVPTTVKIRSGFDERTRDPVGIALRCQDAGAKALCLHPRTRSDMYGGQARWDEIRAVVEALEIPVIGNGDIKTGMDARRMKDETGCAGIMIARGSHGGSVDLHPGPCGAGRQARPPGAGGGGALPHLPGTRPERHRLRAESGAGHHRLPEAPGVVYQGASRWPEPAYRALPGHPPRGGGDPPRTVP